MANKGNIGKEVFEQNSASSFVLKTIKSLKQAQERRESGLKEQQSVHRESKEKLSTKGQIA